MNPIDGVLQPFQSGWTPQGNIDFEPLVTPLYRLKIDLQADPENLVSSYLGFLAGPGVDREAWPFIRWWIEMCIIPKAAEDRELNEVWGGLFQAPTPGIVGAPGTAMNGIKSQIIGLNNNNLGLNLALGAIPNVTNTPGTDTLGRPKWLLAIVDYMEEFCLSIPPVLRAKGGIIGVSDATFQAFRQGQRMKYSQFYAQVVDAALDTVVNFPQFKLQSCLSMGTSDMVWWSPDMNKVRLIKSGANENVFKMECLQRNVYAYTDWWFGLGFIRADFVVYNGQDLTTLGSGN